MNSVPRHVYVHVPFCARRCTYCDFAIAVRREVPVRGYVAGVAAELRLRLEAGAPSEVDTIYLGGGTPSLLGATGIADVLGVLEPYFSRMPNAEVTLEANPEDVTEVAAAAWRTAGINRVSLGIQSFDPRVLAWMHRVHDVAGAERAAHVIAAAGFTSWSLDLIFAVPPELDRNWMRDLDAALALAPPHISTYGLTVEPQTPLSKWLARGIATAVSEETYEKEFLETHQTLTQAGLIHYEVSNYGLPGHGSRHNSAYWTGASYLGVGPSAHSFTGSSRRWNTREYQAWSAQLQNRVDPVGGSEVLTQEQRELEQRYLGLRSSDGIRVDEVPSEIVESWAGQGWALVEESRVRLTPTGWLRLDALVAALTTHSNRC